MPQDPRRIAAENADPVVGAPELPAEGGREARELAGGGHLPREIQRQQDQVRMLAPDELPVPAKAVHCHREPDDLDRCGRMGAVEHRREPIPDCLLDGPVLEHDHAQGACLIGREGVAQGNQLKFLGADGGHGGKG